MKALQTLRRNLTRPRYMDEIEIPWNTLAGMVLLTVLFTVFLIVLFYVAQVLGGS